MWTSVREGSPGAPGAKTQLLLVHVLLWSGRLMVAECFTAGNWRAQSMCASLILQTMISAGTWLVPLWALLGTSQTAATEHWRHHLQIDRWHVDRQSIWGIYRIGQKARLGFSVTLYAKTQANILANPVCARMASVWTDMEYRTYTCTDGIYMDSAVYRPYICVHDLHMER